MSQALKNLDVKKVVKAFKVFGFIPVATNKHLKLVKPGHPFHVSLPVGHKGKTIHEGILARQIKNAGLTEEEFLKEYNKL